MFSALVFILNFVTVAFINLTVGVKADLQGNTIMIVVITMQTVALFFDCNISNGVFKKYRVQIFCGYFLRLCLMLWDLFARNIFVLPNAGGDADTYYYNGIKFIEDPSYENTDEYLRGGLYARAVGTIFKLVGVNRMYAQFIIVMCSILILWLFAKSVKMLDLKERHAAIFMFIICLLPNFAILSSSFTREIPIALFTSISVYLFLYVLYSGRYIAIIPSFVFLMLGAALHTGVSALIAGYVLVLFLYNTKLKKYVFSPTGLVFASLITVVFLFLFVNYGSTFFYKIQKVETVDDLNNRDQGGSSYAKYVGDSKNPGAMLIYTIPRMLYFLCSPFPWQWRHFADLFSFLFSSCYYMIAIVLCLKTIRKCKGEKRNLAIAFLIISICVAFVFGWGVTNTGTAIRHRDKMILLFGLMNMVYFSQLGRKTYKVRKKKFISFKE